MSLDTQLPQDVRAKLARDSSVVDTQGSFTAAISILIVEDDRMISRLLAEMLRDLGYAVCAVVATEEEAVAEAARHKPGLMIVDQHLREGTGMSAVDRILRTRPVPCVFLSGSPLQPSRAATMVLLKPFREEDLARAIESVVHCSDAPAPESLNLVDRWSAGCPPGRGGV
jgi:two-component system, response regulator PdtaR